MQLKQRYTIGCCGIDCGLCPRFHTNGPSACPGCGGPDFQEKHPSCGFVTCCVKKRGLEVCSDCIDFPCFRFESEKNGFDSFVTHKRVFPNLDFIKEYGMELFLDQQKLRMNVLNDFIANFDDGRSKSFYCLTCALLPVDKLIEAKSYMVSQTELLKDKCKMLRVFLQETADELGIELKLKNK
jgi:hypothetical protein